MQHTLIRVLMTMPYCHSKMVTNNNLLFFSFRHSVLVMLQYFLNSNFVPLVLAIVFAHEHRRRGRLNAE